MSLLIPDFREKKSGGPMNCPQADRPDSRWAHSAIPRSARAREEQRQSSERRPALEKRLLLGVVFGGLGADVADFVDEFGHC